MLVKRSMFCVPSYFLCFSVFAMVKHSIRLRAEKTGNPVFLNLVPLLVGNVGPIFTKGDLKEVDEEVAKYKVGAPARTGLVAHIDVIAPPGNTGLNLAHTRASIKPISPTFSRVSIKMTLHYQPIKEVALGNTPIIAFCDTDSPMQCVALLLRDHAAAVTASGPRRHCHSPRQCRHLRLEGQDPPGAVLAPPRSRSCPPSPKNP